MLLHASFRHGVVLLRLVILVVAVAGACQAAPLRAQVDEAEYSVRVLSSDEYSIVVEMSVYDYQLRPFSDGQGLYSVKIEPLSSTMEPEWPQVPFFAAVLGTPTLEDLQISVLERDAIDVSGYELAPAPRAQVVTSGLSEDDASTIGLLQPLNVQVIETRDTHPLWSQEDTFLPQDTARLAPLGGLNGQPAVQLLLYPVQHRPSDHTTRITTRQVVEVRWSEPESSVAALQNSTPSRPLDSLVQSVFLNSDALPAPMSNTPQVEASQYATLGNIEGKIIVRADGVYKVDISELEKPDELVLHNRYCGVPSFLMNDEREGKIYLVFYGVGIHRPFPGEQVDRHQCQSVTSGNLIAPPADSEAPDFVYTDENVYWLVRSSSDVTGLRMKVAKGNATDAAVAADVFRITRHFEENLGYWHGSGLTSFGSQQSPNDHWFWTDLGQTPEIDGLRFHAPIAGAAGVVLSMRAKSYPVPEPLTYEVELGGVKMNAVNRSGGGERETAVTGSLVSTYVADVDLSGVDSLTVGIDGADVATSSLLDWIQITYTQQYVADSGLLLFGRTSMLTETIQVKGFDAEEQVYVFDITDPYSTNIVEMGTVDGETMTRELTVPALQEIEPNLVSCQNALVLGRCYLAISASEIASIALLTKGSSPLDLDEIKAADYIVIAPSEEMGQLPEFEKPRNMTMTTVLLSQIYDHFNAGIPNPRAIRDFLAYVYHWKTGCDGGTAGSELYALLVGDASQGHLLRHEAPTDGTTDRYVSIATVTPAYKFESALYSEVTSDFWLGMVDQVKLVEKGNGIESLCNSSVRLAYQDFDVYWPLTRGGDAFPDVMIGRLPVANADELQQYWSKVNYYEQASMPARGQALYIADDETKFHNITTSLAEDLVARLGVIATKYLLVDHSQSGDGTQPPYFPVRATPNFHQQVARQIVSELNGTELIAVDSEQTGRYDLLTYIGHGNYNSWGYWDVDNEQLEDAYILLDEDLDYRFTVEPPESLARKDFCLNNGARMPFVMVGNCLNGFYAGDFDKPSMAEAWLTPPNQCMQNFAPETPDQVKGAIAVFAPSGLGFPTGHETLLMAMNGALADRDYHLGTLANRTFVETVARQGSYVWWEMAMTYHLFGDPFIELNLPKMNQFFPISGLPSAK